MCVFVKNVCIFVKNIQKKIIGNSSKGIAITIKLNLKIKRQMSKMNGQIILATGGYDHTIKLWRAETKDCIKSMQHADSVIWINRSTFIPIVFFQRNNFLFEILASECIGSDAR